MSEDRGRRRFENDLRDLLGEVVASGTGLTDIDFRQLGVPSRWHRRLLAASKDATTKADADETAASFAHEIFAAVDAGDTGSPGKHRAANMLADRIGSSDSRLIERVIDNELEAAERRDRRTLRLADAVDYVKPAPTSRPTPETREQREARIISRIQNRER